ncbi:hypothetical protein DV515_00013209 [Chloebia gouldiae]|uniref:Uncharacterized protein n=1 Tax=Chloebia gouldiae TaxID=44316 RepID=A0A3L8S2S1_CHLGU|nr:hypothetical protein DV515_00013209 [Chloebia gouldiae]
MSWLPCPGGSRCQAPPVPQLPSPQECECSCSAPGLSPGEQSGQRNELLQRQGQAGRVLPGADIWCSCKGQLNPRASEERLQLPLHRDRAVTEDNLGPSSN